MEKQPEISVHLLSSVLTIIAHNAPVAGGLRYSVHVTDGNNRTLAHHYAMSQPYIKGQALVLDNSEIYLSDGAALLVEEFLQKTCAHVSRPRQFSLHKSMQAGATA